MKLNIFCSLFFLGYVLSCTTSRSAIDGKNTEQRPPVRCIENSPERQGEEGCTILANRPLSGPLPDKLYWHIDRFDSLEEAKKAASPNGVAAEAHGYFWLMTVEVKSEDHHGGHHDAWIGPLVLPPAKSYSMRVLSSYLKAGSETPIHTHSGPEAFFVVDGDQCIEMLDYSQHLVSGQSYVVPANTIHRGRAIGSKGRRVLALNLYDAAYPVSSEVDKPLSLNSCNK